MNVLITGGTGFIGAHLARFHAERGDRVLLFDNLFKTSGRRDEDLNRLLARPNVTLARVDMTRPIGRVRAPRRLDVVYHLAAINGTRLFYEMPYQVARTNLLLTLNLLDWLEGRSVGRLLYSSTSEIYAGAEAAGVLEVPTDETVPAVFPAPPGPRLSYGTSKYMGEFLCLYFGKRFRVPSTVIRYHNIYGPRMGDKHVVPEFIARLRGGESPLKLYGGMETRAFCYVEDAVRATWLAASSRRCAGEIVHIGDPKAEVRIDALARRLIRLMGLKTATREHGRREGSVSRRCPDTAKLKRLTGFEPKVGLDEGLRRTLEWYLAR